MSGGISAKIDNGSNKITDVGIGTISVGKGRAEQGDNNAIGPIYRSQVARTSWPTIPNVTTLYELFERSVRKNPERRCIGWRPIRNGSAQPYTFHTYKETQGSMLFALNPGLSKTLLRSHQALHHACVCRKSQECCLCFESCESWPSW
jgi:hypothetical protein